MIRSTIHITHNSSLLRLSLIFGFLLYGLVLFAQHPNFVAKASKTEVPLNQNFQITYSFNNVDAESLNPPSFEDFKFLGQSQSSSTNIYNNQVNRTVSYKFTLRPTKEGTFEIPPATARIDGKTVKSNALTIKVVASVSQPANPNQPNSSNNQSIQEQIAKNLYVRAIPSKRTIYEGEQISITYKMLYRVNLQDISITKAPSFDGFLSQEIELTQDQMQRKIEEFNDNSFYSILVKRYALFPTRSGSFTLDPINIESIVAVERDSRSFFRSYDQIPFETKSNPINITVKPLPKANQPIGFTGVVGNDFKFSVEYDKTETKVDDPITLKIKVSGKGNIKLIGTPTFDLPQSFEVYDPEIKEYISEKSYTVNGSKTFEYLIVPRGGGEFQFPDITFSYFDLEKENYVTKTESGPLVTVEGEAFTTQNGYNPVSREEVELLGEDIKFIKTEPIELKQKQQQNIIARPIFHLFTWIPLLLAFFIPIINKKRKEANKDIVKVKSKKALKEASKRLSTAKKLLSGNDDKAFYNEIVKSVWGYLGDKFNISAAELSKEKAIDILKENSVNSILIDDTSKLISDCEIAVYAPSAIGESKQSILIKAESLIENIEKEIRNL